MSVVLLTHPSDNYYNRVNDAYKLHTNNDSDIYAEMVEVGGRTYHSNEPELNDFMIVQCEETYFH